MHSYSRATHIKSHLPESAGLDRGVVEAPDLLTVVPLIEEGEVIHVLYDGPESRKHANASVLHLCLTSPSNWYGADRVRRSNTTRQVKPHINVKLTVADTAEDTAVDSP